MSSFKDQQDQPIRSVCKKRKLNEENNIDKDGWLMEAVDKSNVKEVASLVKIIEDVDTLSLAQEIAQEKGNITIIKVIDRAVKKMQEKEDMDKDSLLMEAVEIPLKAASALTENLPDLNPTTQVDNSGINTEQYDFAGMVNKAIEMHASTFDTDTYTELCKRNL